MTPRVPRSDPARIERHELKMLEKKRRAKAPLSQVRNYMREDLYRAQQKANRAECRRLERIRIFGNH